MQPYFFPYIGYFQLIKATDLFIFYDDVNFITRGWINRNKVLVNGKPTYFTIPCKDASQNKLIYEVGVALTEKKTQKLLKTIYFSYKNAPYFESVYALIKDVLHTDVRNIAELSTQSVTTCMDYLDIGTDTKMSSEQYENRSLDRADRLIDICKQEKATHYINAQGGKKLYEKTYFERQGIQLQFLEPEPIEYKQFGEVFEPYLSIIDVMMFNSPQKIRDDFLNKYRLV